MGIISTAVRHAMQLGATQDQILQLVQDLEAEIGYFFAAGTTPTLDTEKISQENHSVRAKNGRKRVLESNSPIDYRTIDGKVDTEFNRFWAIYPRREAKGGARRAFKAARKKAPIETILAMAQKFADKRRGEDKQFTPLASTWLNQERWLDEEDVKKQTLSGPRWADVKYDYEQRYGRGKPALDRYIADLASTQTGSLPAEPLTTKGNPPGRSSSGSADSTASAELPCEAAAGKPTSFPLEGKSLGKCTSLALGSEPLAEQSTRMQELSGTTFTGKMGGTDAVVPGYDEAEEGRTRSKEPKMARIRDFLPPLLRVDDPQEDQAAVFAEAVPDAVSVCGYPWDEPEAFNL